MAALQIGHSQDPIGRILAKTKDLAALPQVVFKITEMAGSVDSSAAALEKVIIVDPGFAAKVLMRANSAHYALPKKLTSIREAVTFIGLKAVRELAMNVGVFDMFLGKTDKESLRRRAWWRHSVDTAVTAAMVAEIGGGDPDEAYAAGLLHFIGKTVMDRFDPESYEKVVLLVDRGVPDWKAETAVFGCDHGKMATALAEKWGFPERLASSLDYLRKPQPGSDAAKTRAAVAIGHKIAKMVVSGARKEDIEAHHLPEWAMETLNIMPDKADYLFEKGQVEIARAAKMGM